METKAAIHGLEATPLETRCSLCPWHFPFSVACRRCLFSFRRVKSAPQLRHLILLRYLREAASLFFFFLAVTRLYLAALLLRSKKKNLCKSKGGCAEGVKKTSEVRPPAGSIWANTSGDHFIKTSNLFFFCFFPPRPPPQNLRFCAAKHQEEKFKMRCR